MARTLLKRFLWSSLCQRAAIPGIVSEGVASIPTSSNQHFTLLQPLSLTTKSFHLSSSFHGPSCWSCGQNFTKPVEYFCPKCALVQEIGSKPNYFEMFDLEKQFTIDTKSLQHKFTNLQRRLHPDKFSLKSAEEQEISSNVSAMINKAYSTLLKPLSRGIYMLEQNGVHFGEEIRADEPELLMELMDINEKVDESTLETKREIFNEMQNKLGEVTETIQQSFTKNDIETVKKSVIRLKYYSNISDRLREQLPPE